MKRKRIDERDEVFRYIGETSRSAWERAEEHWKDLEFKRPKSHMLRHVVEHHQGVEPEKIDFRIQILSSHRSAFERQIREAVLIERYDGQYSMNSKLEYSRTVIPKIKLKMGEKQEKESPRITKEKEIVEKIKILQAEFNNKKRNKRTDQHTIKRLKLDENDS